MADDVLTKRARMLVDGTVDPDPATREERLTAPGRFLLIERSHRNGNIYPSRHDSLEEAGSYHATQEFAEDWAVEDFVDLETGRRFYPVHTVDWEACGRHHF